MFADLLIVCERIFSRAELMWRSIDRLRSFRFTSVLKLQLEPMDLNSKIKLTFLLLQLGTSNLCHL